MPADAFGYQSMTAFELMEELATTLEKWPQLANEPVWANPGGPLILSLRDLGVRPGERGNPQLRIVLNLNR